VVTEKPTEEVGIITTNVLNSDRIQVFVDQSADFSLLNIRPGNTLEILNSDNAGKYIIDQVSFNGDVTQLLVIGTFKTIISGLNYRITDTLKPEFSVEDFYTPENGKVILGEGVYQSGALISCTTYSFKKKFESQYVAVDVSSVPTQEVIINHDLGFIPTDIRLFVSQANDGSEPVETISSAGTSNDLTVSVNNTLSYTQGTFNPGTSDASYVDGNLSGDVTASLVGSVYDLRSALVRVTKTQIFIKNVKPNHFYRDYDGIDRSTGFLKAVCK
jgi:hypothetical protein